MIESLILRLCSVLRSNEHKHWYPLGINKFVSFIEHITDVLILTEAEGHMLKIILGY